VAIRTVRLTPGENNRHQAVAGVGGAIVADSQGIAEWRECLVKGGFLRGAASGAT
jgi:para-aminobenzoate synthetase / 4-amino-4-deoxychorismate lyase